MKKEYVSLTTAEIVVGKIAVIKTILGNFFKLHFLDLRWVTFD